MKTDKLISALVADRAAGRGTIRRSLLAALALGGLVSLALFVLDLGLRKDLAQALATWRFELKVGLVALALASAFGLCTALSRPVPSAPSLRRLLPLAAVAALAIAIELAALPRASWGARLVGSNSLVCLAAIPMLAVAPLAAVLWAMRAGAPASPALAGAAAGFLAAAAGATLYAFHCFDDSPLFVMTWYVLAAIPVIALGALAGHRLLRW
ncbi:MAG: NrsF family protein [Alphaproteobacteria bacterium]|nr:NrsF family protein [Alphaproteobacteria bacterium]